MAELFLQAWKLMGVGMAMMFVVLSVFYIIIKAFMILLPATGQDGD